MSPRDEYFEWRFGPVGGVSFATGFWVRAGGWFLRVRTPRDKPLFSERYGFHKPLVKAFGYRLFVEADPLNLPKIDALDLTGSMMKFEGDGNG